MNKREGPILPSFNNRWGFFNNWENENIPHIYCTAHVISADNSFCNLLVPYQSIHIALDPTQGRRAPFHHLNKISQMNNSKNEFEDI